jgi:hypothetical protein
VELVMWIVLGIVAGLGFIVLVPVLVVGTWFVVLTVILGLADGTIWLLDQGWKKKKNRKATPAFRVLAVESLSRGTP